ncbi:hypothetical protein GBO60_06010 [Pediococcus acidilactici]|uniref:hypothetical protein n=1 Tax=Pediococcus acidilactici TaxID=1254 RepID=UPI00132B3A81|nr:hypothetical protein [Pediococcus acidilactici]KAF0370746.1 hypothetical protein GBO60_06010 [Pediococcus acidilactici]KAF0389544.1 hypothetical protein GBO67_06010 [Pediococcus acidilactici]
MSIALENYYVIRAKDFEKIKLIEQIKHEIILNKKSKIKSEKSKQLLNKLDKISFKSSAFFELTIPIKRKKR